MGRNALDAVEEQRIPGPVNLRREPAGGEAQRARPSPVVLTAGRRAARVSKIDQRVEVLGCGGGAEIRKRLQNQPVGEGMEQRRRARDGLLSGGAASLW
jgi:hypothetical protein